MFSLSALVNKAAANPAAPSSPTTSDDSGLIDFKALLSDAKQTPTTDLIPTHVDVFPLGRPPLPSTEAVEIPVASATATPLRKTKAVWIAGAGLLAAALTGVAWNLLNTPSQVTQTAERGISAAAARQTLVIEKASAPDVPDIQEPKPPPAPTNPQPPIRPIKPPVNPVKPPPRDPTPPVDTTPCDLHCQIKRAVEQSGKPKP